MADRTTHPAPHPVPPQALEQAAQTLANGQLVAIPTETVYGLAANADDAQAVGQIFTRKGRPNNHPLIVHVSGQGQVDRFACQVPAFAVDLMRHFWPGPLTVILPKRPGVADAAAGGQASIGLRCPSHPVAQALLHACERLGVAGLAAPSANQFGRISPTTAQHVKDDFGADLPVLDGGPCSVGIESTIVDCSRGVPVLLRPGMLTRQALEQAMGQKVWAAHEALPQAPVTDQAAPRASGTLSAHYAPRAPLYLLPKPELTLRLQRISDTRPMAVYAFERPKILSARVHWRAMPPKAADCAHDLFAVLRDFDQLGASSIWVEQPPSHSDWDGVRDRLQRAATVF